MKTPATPSIVLPVMAYCIIAFQPPTAAADAISWDGEGVDSDFFNGVNWSSDGVPAAAAIVISNDGGIPNQPVLSGQSPFLSSWSHSAGLLTITQTGILDTQILAISGTGSARIDGLVNGNVTHNGGQLNISGTVNGNLESFSNVALSGSVNGNININGGVLSLSGNGSSLQSLFLSGGTLNADAGSHQISAFEWTGGTVNVNGGKLTISSALDLPQAGLTQLNLNAGTLALGGVAPMSATCWFRPSSHWSSPEVPTPWIPG